MVTKILLNAKEYSILNMQTDNIFCTVRDNFS